MQLLQLTINVSVQALQATGVSVDHQLKWVVGGGVAGKLEETDRIDMKSVYAIRMRTTTYK